jgi:hypothetical protein
MNYKELINAELSKLGFNEIIYNGNEYNKFINAYDNLEDKAELKLKKLCLVSGVKFTNTEDDRMISCNISFVDIENNCKEMLDNLLISNYNGDITPINETDSNNQFELNIIVKKGE